jgi:hypothetical protein
MAVDPMWRTLTWTRLLPNVRESTILRSLDPRRLVLINARNKRRWSDLCGEAEVEANPEKLQMLAEQIMRILDSEQKRLRNPRNHRGPKVRRAAKTRQSSQSVRTNGPAQGVLGSSYEPNDQANNQEGANYSVSEHCGLLCIDEPRNASSFSGRAGVDFYTEWFVCQCLCSFGHIRLFDSQVTARGIQGK